jgi:hypothetical protein
LGEAYRLSRGAAAARALIRFVIFKRSTAYIRLADSGSCCNGTGKSRPFKENDMSIGLILLIILVLVLAGAIPAWPHSRSWGYGPSGGIGLIVVVLVILLLLGKI